VRDYEFGILNSEFAAEGGESDAPPGILIFYSRKMPAAFCYCQLLRLLFL